MIPTAGLEPSYAAIILVVVLVGLCFPLYFSMRKHVRRSTVPTAAEYRAAEQAEKQSNGEVGGEGLGPSRNLKGEGSRLRRRPDAGAAREGGSLG